MAPPFMEQNSIERTSHPAYSPDLTPYDFYHFGNVKQLLSGSQIADQGSVLQAVSDIVVGIEKVILEKRHSKLDGETVPM
jgi:hypothetical protein